MAPRAPIATRGAITKTFGASTKGAHHALGPNPIARMRSAEKLGELERERGGEMRLQRAALEEDEAKIARLVDSSPTWRIESGLVCFDLTLAQWFRAPGLPHDRRACAALLERTSSLRLPGRSSCSTATTATR